MASLLAMAESPQTGVNVPVSCVGRWAFWRGTGWENKTGTKVDRVNRGVPEVKLSYTKCCFAGALR